MYGSWQEFRPNPYYKEPKIAMTAMNILTMVIQGIQDGNLEASTVVLGCV